MSGKIELNDKSAENANEDRNNVQKFKSSRFKDSKVSEVEMHIDFWRVFV